MTPEILARITAARAARDLSDLARQAVGTTAEDISPTERIKRARRLRQMANQIVDLLVVAEAMGGAEWMEVTEALGREDPGTVEREYADAVAEWGIPVSEDESDTVTVGIKALDAWYGRHRQDDDPDLENPVADLLNRR